LVISAYKTESKLSIVINYSNYFYEISLGVEVGGTAAVYYVEEDDDYFNSRLYMLASIL
jgi:hypothetical protein